MGAAIGEGAVAAAELHAALAAIAEGKGKDVDAIRLGYWLRKWKDRYAGGFQLLRFGPKESRAAQWEIKGGWGVAP